MTQENRCDIALEPGQVRVVVTGEVDLSWSSEIRDQILRALKENMPVKVDLSAVSYIDSSGIAALVEGLQQARKSGIPFVLQRPSPAVLSVLNLARLDQVFEVENP